MLSEISRRKFVKVSSLGIVGFAFGYSVKNRFGIIIKNGTVINGSDSAPKRLDVGITGEKITALGDLSSAGADIIIDAAGLIVAPGFIDIHTHTDIELLVNPLAESKIRQGVTTEIAGNCGSSPFPLNASDQKRYQKRWQERYGLNVIWDDLDGFFHQLETTKIAMNYGTLTGQGTLRSMVVGKNDVPATPDQITEMKLILARTIEQGSLGLSTGLEYSPGSYADTAELIELSKTVAKYNGVYATHMRNEDDTVEEAVDEALRICREAEVSTQISHLKACNHANWHKVDRILNMVGEAAQQLPVQADRYPYIAWGTGLASFLPLWSRQGETEDVLARLKDPAKMQKIGAYASDRADRIGGWDRVMISYCASEENRKWEGKTIQTCAEEAGKPPVDFIQTLLIDERTRVGIVGFAMDENNLKKVLATPFIMIGSDGNATAPYGKLGHGKPHPRFYGTHPRVLGKYCREEKIFDLPTAIRKMTSMPAEKLGLKDRGVLAEDKIADVTIFNPETVIDNATFIDPHRYPTGIEYVLVNGQITISKGEHTGVKAGQIVRHRT